MSGASSILDMASSWAEKKESVLELYSQVPKANVYLFVMFVVMGLFQYAKNKRQSQSAETSPFSTSEYLPIEPLKDFQWEKTEPLKFRPYKPKFHLTMALENLTPSELIPMDKTYKERIMHRRGLLKEYPDVVRRVNCEGDNPRIRAAVGELYTFVMGIYLPTRYPRMFKPISTKYESGQVHLVQNLVTGEMFPTQLSPSRPIESALETLCKNVDEDMLILLPEQNSVDEASDEGEIKVTKRRKQAQEKESNVSEKGAPTAAEGNTKYILEAYVACFPSGFDTRKKLGRRLNEIHIPVPGYKEKLEKSMDRFFERLEVGKLVKRVNWSITEDAELFTPFSGVHGKEGVEQKPLKLEELNVDNTFMRCERQTLYRLPKSRALVFSFHTYRYPIREIKDEGSGEELAVAIDGIREGTIPGMANYKRVPVWGEAVKEFLRS